MSMITSLPAREIVEVGRGREWAVAPVRHHFRPYEKMPTSQLGSFATHHLCRPVRPQPPTFSVLRRTSR